MKTGPKPRSLEEIQASIDRRKQYLLDYAANNKTKLRDKANRWTSNNRDKSRANRRAYKKANPEKIAAEKARYKKAKPERVSQWHRTREATKKGVSERFTSEQHQRVLEQFKNCCFRCKSVENLTLDHHLPLSKGFALEFGNAVILCALCNSTKSGQMPSKFYTDQQLRRLTKLLMEQIRF